MGNRPMHAKQTAVFWIEHILQFGGDHLKPSSVNLKWFQYFCLDTTAFLTITLLVALLVVKCLLKLTVGVLLLLFQKRTNR